MGFELAFPQWRDGERRLAALRDPEAIAAERVTDEIQAELRRRLGSSFTTSELAELYERGTDWCLDVAVRIAPGAPWAWDARTTADAAFARYVRFAADYAGGRRLHDD